MNVDSVYKLIEKAQSDMGLKFREFEKKENEYIEKAKILDEKIKAYEFKYSNLVQEFEKSELHVSQLKTKLIEMEELQNSHDKIAEEVERLKEKVQKFVITRVIITFLIAYSSCSAQRKPQQWN